MNTYVLECSATGIFVDYATELHADTEPDFWTCYEIAQKHGCDYFTITEKQ